MLSQWLAPRDLTWFRERHFQRAPLANPNAATSASALLDWDTVVRVLQSELPLNVLTVARGRLVQAAVPRTLGDVQRLIHAGISVVIRSAELHDPGLAALAESFRRALPGEVHSGMVGRGV